MPKKKLKLNERGEAQLSVWLPAKVVQAVWDDYKMYADKAIELGDMKPNFKNYFYEKYLMPNLTK